MVCVCYYWIIHTQTWLNLRHGNHLWGKNTAWQTIPLLCVNTLKKSLNDYLHLGWRWWIYHLWDHLVIAGRFCTYHAKTFVLFVFWPDVFVLFCFWWFLFLFSRFNSSKFLTRTRSKDLILTTSVPQFDDRLLTHVWAWCVKLFTIGISMTDLPPSGSFAYSRKGVTHHTKKTTTNPHHVCTLQIHMDTYYNNNFLWMWWLMWINK